MCTRRPCAARALRHAELDRAQPRRVVCSDSIISTPSPAKPVITGNGCTVEDHIGVWLTAGRRYSGLNLDTIGSRRRPETDRRRRYRPRRAISSAGRRAICCCGHQLLASVEAPARVAGAPGGWRLRRVRWRPGSVEVPAVSRRAAVDDAGEISLPLRPRRRGGRWCRRRCRRVA